VAILAQRLVRLNCPKCREPYRPTKDEIELLKLTPEMVESGKWGKGKGCPDCRGTGYKGRLGVFELILGTPDFRAAVANKVDFAELMRWHASRDTEPCWKTGLPRRCPAGQRLRKF